MKGIDENLLTDAELWYEYVFKLPSDFQIIYTIIILDWQVNNGGFHQYFFNAYGQFAFLTIKNSELIKAVEHKTLLEKALKKTNSDKFSEVDFRKLIYHRKLKKIVEFENKLFKQLDDLDTQYYDLKEDLRQLYVNFISHS